jgi:hypothetical protein
MQRHRDRKEMDRQTERQTPEAERGERNTIEDDTYSTH